MITGSGEGEIEYKLTVSKTLGVVTIDETGSNTGVFESDDGGDSEISSQRGRSSGDTFTIAVCDDSQQIIVDDFDSTLELIADGTWDSSEPLTIRLTNENLDLNTLDTTTTWKFRRRRSCRTGDGRPHHTGQCEICHY